MEHRSPPRAGAMTVAMNAVGRPTAPPGTERALRVMVLRDGVVVEERTFRSGRVTVGSSARSDFTIAGPGIARAHRLFDKTDHGYVLHLVSGMGARLARGDSASVIEVDDRAESVTLDDTARGRITIGKHAFLFQFIEVLRAQPRPRLPATVRGGVVKSIDWIFTSFVVASFALHFGFVVFLDNHDWPTSAAIAEIPPELARFVLPEEPEPSAPDTPARQDAQPTPDAAEDQSTPEEPRDRADHRTRVAPAPAPSEGAPIDRATLIAEASAAAEQILVTSNGGAAGAMANLLANAPVIGTAEEVLASTSGILVADGRPAVMRNSTPGSGISMTGPGQRHGGTQVIDDTVVIERRLVVRPEDPEVIDEGGEFEQAVVTRLVRTRLAQIRACYESEVRHDIDLRGKVSVQLTIQPVGTVTDVHASENTMGNDDVARCVVGVFRGFRFNPGPRGGSVTYEYPFLFEPTGR